jgi:hypothetical protein
MRFAIEQRRICGVHASDRIAFADRAARNRPLTEALGCEHTGTGKPV